MEAFMQSRLTIISTIFYFFLINNAAYASSSSENRTMQFSNDKVSVWKTVISKTTSQVLKMHRHEHDRVLVAFTNGLLKITNDIGKVHYLKLEKNKAYYLSKDVPNELHKDENMSAEPIEVLVIELKN